MWAELGASHVICEEGKAKAGRNAFAESCIFEGVICAGWRAESCGGVAEKRLSLIWWTGINTYVNRAVKFELTSRARGNTSAGVGIGIGRACASGNASECGCLAVEIGDGWAYGYTSSS